MIQTPFFNKLGCLRLMMVVVRLGHSNLSTTSRYLTSLASAENASGDALATLFGLDK
jgi:hypothetical protein